MGARHGDGAGLRQGEARDAQRGAPARGGCDLHLETEKPRETADDGETETEAIRLGRVPAFGAIELVEDVAEILLGDAGTVI